MNHWVKNSHSRNFDHLSKHVFFKYHIVTKHNNILISGSTYNVFTYYHIIVETPSRSNLYQFIFNRSSLFTSWYVRLKRISFFLQLHTDFNASHLKYTIGPTIFFHLIFFIMKLILFCYGYNSNCLY